MARQITIADKAIATGAMIQLFGHLGLDIDASEGFARDLVAAALDVRYRPSTQHLVLTFDLSGPAAEDDPAGVGPGIKRSDLEPPEGI